MKIRCNICGRPVTNELPENTVCTGWVECTDCIDKDAAFPYKKVVNVGKDVVMSKISSNDRAN
jgi:hypothetical protein